LYGLEASSIQGVWNSSLTEQN